MPEATSGRREPELKEADGSESLGTEPSGQKPLGGRGDGSARLNCWGQEGRVAERMEDTDSSFQPV